MFICYVVSFVLIWKWCLVVSSHWYWCKIYDTLYIRFFYLWLLSCNWYDFISSGELRFR